MILLHVQNWDNPDYFKLITEDNFFDSLPRIFLCPFSHSTDTHLINNVVPLFFLMCLLRYIFNKFSYVLFFLIYFLTGFLMWRFIPNQAVIGASGVLYGMVSFLFFSGLIRNNRELLGYSLLIVFLYGGMVWGMFEPFVKQNVSWESHLIGFIVGLILAFLFRKKGPQKKVYDWENEDLDDDNNDVVTVEYEYHQN